jgi:hypothetical protein
MVISTSQVMLSELFSCRHHLLTRFDSYLDWLPTLMHVATNGEWSGSYNGTALDGMDQWDAVSTLGDSPRSEIVFYASDKDLAIQMGDYRYYYSSTGEPSVTDPGYVFPEDSGLSASQYVCEDISLVNVERSASLEQMKATVASAYTEVESGDTIPVSFIVGMILIGTILLALFKCLEMQTTKMHFVNDKAELTRPEEVPLYYHLDSEDRALKA